MPLAESAVVAHGTMHCTQAVTFSQNFIGSLLKIPKPDKKDLTPGREE
jgi:hypothetical protein